ncbi:MAG: DTW domain-containing protein, partial [Acidobacteriota bacterium]
MAKSPEPPAVDAAAETREACGVCARPPVVCVCDRVTALKTRRRLLILQHPREKDEILGSAQILTASLPKARLAVGLSWRGLKHALGEESARGGSWAGLSPDRSGSRPGGGKARGPAKGPLARVENRRGRAVDPAGIEGRRARSGPQDPRGRPLGPGDSRRGRADPSQGPALCRRPGASRIDRGRER